MPKMAFQPCIPTRGTTVPAGKDWLHEIKHDRYRLIVQREGKRVRQVDTPLFIPDRFTLVVHSERVNRPCQIVWRNQRRMGVTFKQGGVRTESVNPHLSRCAISS